MIANWMKLVCHENRNNWKDSCWQTRTRGVHETVSKIGDCAALENSEIDTIAL